MKDIVENRKRLGWGQKLQLGALAVRENGIFWTLLLGVYGGASALANAAHSGMQRLRVKKGIPGMNSREMNRLIWENWDWSGGGDEWTPSEEWKASLMQNVLRPAIPEGTSVVEIGPGGGRWTAELIARCQSYRGLDISQSCVDLCREKFGADARVSFDVTDGKSLPGVSDGSVARVWSFDVFVHINSCDLESYLREIQRVLQPGGMAVIHHGSVAGERGGWRSDVTTAKFNELAEAAGFRVVSQISGWQDGGQYHRAGLYEDMITTIEKPPHG